LPAAIGALREREGRSVNIMGSSKLVMALLEQDLVDDLNLMIEPIILGGGKSIFPADGVARNFELVSSQTAHTGVQVCLYKRAR
jgi:dihydrofolate reductase